MTVIALLLSVIPAKAWAQDYRLHENGFLFNIFEIENVEERVQLASALSTSEIWLCNPTENPGELFIRPNSYYADIPIYAEFDYLRMTLREEYEEASSLPKEEFSDILNSWAQTISHEYYNFLISDHLDRANHCMDAEPFCTSDVYDFPALNSGYSWSGPNYGCLGTSPTNKHSFWYYMRIGVAGNITIKIEASFDVDFALWGPFDNQIDPCPTEAGQAGMLTANCDNCPNNTSTLQPNFYPSGNLHDCSFDARHYEYAHVVNGQVGQYFILLITNYSGSSGNITFQKYAGDGETDCGIMPGIVSNGGPYCVGETVQLTVNEQNSATYAWTGPDGWTSNLQSPTRPNCTMSMAGTYSCTTMVGSQSVTAETIVVINPQPTAGFNFTSVCIGETTEFTSTSTTNPSGMEITDFTWDFGDGNTGNGQNASHTYTQPGEYEVTLEVETNGGYCTDQITQTVSVYALPAITAMASPTPVIYGATATLTAQVEGQGNYSFLWEPTNMVADPYAQTTQTVPLIASQTYTLTVTNLDTGCTSTTQVTASMEGSNMTATATADEYEICEDGFTTLHALPLNGTGNYTYSWSPANLLNNSNAQNPLATPPLGQTTFSCTINDGIVSQTAEVTVTVHPKEVKDINETICENETYNFFGQDLNVPGIYTHTLQTQYGCDSLVRLNLSLSSLDEYDFDVPEDESCDEYFWDPKGHEIVYSDHESLTYNVSGTYHRTYKNQAGCDSLVTMHVHFNYLPNPTPIYPMDPENDAPHWVVTATEFQINDYDFHLWDTNPHCAWDTVTWDFEQENGWLLEPFGEKGKSCKMFVLNHVEDTVWLRAHASNRCSPQEGVEQRYWFVCSFFGTDEHSESNVDFNVVPNPNNGQMALYFERLTGKVSVKVYDMRGTLIDEFATNIQDGSTVLQYNMKQHANGIYYFVVAGKEGLITKKVVIQP